VWSGCSDVVWMFWCGLDVLMWSGCSDVVWMFWCGLDVLMWSGCSGVVWMFWCGLPLVEHDLFLPWVGTKANVLKPSFFKPF